MIDYILSLIEEYSSRINCWAWDKRWKERKHHTEDWITGYRKWKDGFKR